MAVTRGLRISSYFLRAREIGCERLGVVDGGGNGDEEGDWDWRRK